jgi:hypothetical protein
MAIGHVNLIFWGRSMNERKMGFYSLGLSPVENMIDQELKDRISRRIKSGLVDTYEIILPMGQKSQKHCAALSAVVSASEAVDAFVHEYLQQLYGNSKSSEKNLTEGGQTRA